MNSFRPDDFLKAGKKYQEHTSERIQLSELHPENEKMKAAFSQFQQKPFPLDIGANEGDWIALKLGLKPIIREFVSYPYLDKLQKHCDKHMLQMEVLEASVGESRISGKFVTQQSKAQQRSKNFFVFMGSNQKDLQTLREIHTKMLQSGRKKWFQSARSHRQKIEDLHRKTGELLGYPACCIDAFFPCLEDNRSLLQRLMGNSTSYHPLLNNLSLRMFHYICWTPCRFDCPKSLHVAEKVDQHLQDVGTQHHRNIHRYLSMPRLYLDDRRQILFDGAKVTDNILQYSAAYSPCQFETSKTNIEFDWIFYAQYIAKLNEGNRVQFNKKQIDIFRNEERIHRLKVKTRPLLVPFSQG